MRDDDRTKAYAARRTAEGKTRREIARCIKSPAASKGTSCAKSTPHSAQQNQLKFLLDEHRRINAAIETFFKIIKAKLVWRRTREIRRQAKPPSSNIPTASITRAEAIHHWEAKALWPTNAKQLKKAVGAA
jgi:hypothetical protein